MRWIGRLITWLESALRVHFPPTFAGVLLLLFVVLIVGGTTAAVVALAALWHPWAAVTVASVLVYWGLAARSLARETRHVLHACEDGDWPEARRRLSAIVGRDTAELSPEAIYRACIETVGENASDGVIAPLFHAALFGPVGMWVYKAINTLDSMVGYKNEQYREFGWASARTDDIVNWLPARLTWLLLALAAGRRAGAALRIGWRDGRKHPSPNSAWGEAAIAGALGVQLGGTSSYAGVPSEKPRLGEAHEPLNHAKAQEAIALMLRAAWLGLVGALSTQLLLLWLAKHYIYP